MIYQMYMEEYYTPEEAVKSIVKNNLYGLDIDDILIQNNSIITNVSNSDLDLRTNGTGKLIIDDLELSQNNITNTSDNALTIQNVLYGKVPLRF